MSRRSRVSPFNLSESLAPRVPRVTPDDFVRAWQKAETLADVARALGMNEHACENRAYRYREQGVRLKHLRRHMDVERLNRIVAEIKGPA